MDIDLNLVVEVKSDDCTNDVYITYPRASSDGNESRSITSPASANEVNGMQYVGSDDSSSYQLSSQNLCEDESDQEHCPENEIDALAAQLAPVSTLHSIDEAYVLYCEYARLKGFSVKKGTQSYFQKTDVVRMKMFFCSNEGQTDNRASAWKIAAYKKQHTRTDCRARLKIIREREGPWTVSIFHTEHNHGLLGPDDSYILRSSRNMSLVKQSMLETFREAGIGVSKAYRFVQNEVGGPQNVGYIRKDAYDHINRERTQSKFRNADVGALMQYFQEKSSNEPYFFWRVLLDDDYAAFGDVVLVDTTFRTNKYNLICAPFVGMNHHRQTVMFAMEFLSDESARSFEWLFSVFLESMEGKEPFIIFSDQDQAMMNGIDSVFQRAAHRLCQ